MFELVHLVLDLLQMAKGCQCCFVHRRSRLKVHVLRKQTQSNTARANYITTVGRFFSANETKDCGLACAISADQPHMLARIYLQRSTTQYILRAVRLVDIR
jgi:hypothetical protein